MEETFILNELKNLILLKSGIRTITPSDCKRISIEISKKLHKNVSETTIKRLFGFAVVKHKFSRFTLTTLLEYVDKEDLTRLLPRHPFLPQGSITDNWTTINLNSKKITESTIKSIRNRSGLPYQMTIGRKFSEHDFDDFYNSNYSFTCFVSQPGYGRTILLSHLTENYFLAHNAPYRDCTILFINAYTLFNNEYKTFNIEEQLKFQLGINPSEGLINYINEHYVTNEGKFIFMLDGFAELVLKRESKIQLFESIINFICALEDSNSIKLIMSMRSTTWTRFYERIRHSAYLKSKWFPGNYFNLNDVSNVPPLTEKEVDQIIININPADNQKIHPKLKAQLKFPFHFQLYYQLQQEDPSFNYSTNISFFELISKFIQEKIYRSNYYTEKILFLKKIIQLTDFAKKGVTVAKNELINELAVFRNAYMELISDGILMEERHIQDAHPKEYVRFIQPHIYEYFLFIELLEKYHLKIDQNFFNQIKNEYDGNKVGFLLLQWSARFLIRIGDIKSLCLILHLDLSNAEKNHIIFFIAENLKYRLSYSMETLLMLQEHSFHESAIQQMTNFDFLDSSYIDGINVLLEIADTTEDKLIYHSILSINDILSLKPSRIELRLQQLENLQEETTSPWFINPYEVTWLINQKLQENLIIQHPILQKIEDFKQNPEIFTQRQTKLTTKEAITYLYMCLIQTFYSTEKELIKLIRAIIRLRPELFSHRSPFSILLMNILAISCAKTSPGKKTDQMERLLFRLSENKSRNSFTKYTDGLYLLLQSIQSNNRKEYDLALRLGDETLKLFMHGELNACCLLIYNLFIAIHTELQDFEKVNEYKYEKFCFMEEKGIPKQLLPFSKPVYQ